MTMGSPGFGARRGRAALPALAVLFLGSAGLWVPGLGAQQEGDPRWLPWAGCWSPAEGEAGPAVCVLPGSESVSIVTLAEGEAVARRVLVADGVPRPVEQEGCSGEETARFSADGRRVFISGELHCQGGGGRSTAGILALLPGEEWLEVNVVEVEGETVSWVQRRRPAPRSLALEAGLPEPVPGLDTAVRTGRLRAAALPSVDDVVEASGAVPPEAVEAWLAERGEPLDLDAAGLVRMADAGVPERTIDVAVAVSNPQRFAVDRSRGVMEERWGGRPPIRAHAWIPLDPWVGGYRSYGWGYGYSTAFLPWGYGPAWGYGYGYGYRPPVIIVDRNGPPAPRGRVVRGRGYVGGSSSGEAGPPVRREGSPFQPERRGDRSSPGTSGSSSGSSGSSASPSPSSSGGGSTGRTAQPRTP